MTITQELANRFYDIIEFSGVPWSIVDEVATSDANILRPVKGVCFEEFFCLTIRNKDSEADITGGPGDSDVDLILNGVQLQLKTIDTGSTQKDNVVGVALHKTHGNERRPYNLYPIDTPVFDFLVVLHPEEGILIIPWNDIPTHNTWSDYLDDPAKFDWNSSWLNKWDLLGYPQFSGQSIESRTVPKKSDLPKLSSETFLEDYQIIDVLCRPEYFRAAVMGLKGNIKEYWMKDILRKKGYFVSEPTGSYPKYDLITKLKDNTDCRVQVKGTSKNMCDSSNEMIGLEVMGTHGQFPKRGYKKSYFDYISVVISEKQLNPEYDIPDNLHFLFIPVEDLPLHYLIGNGDETIDTGWGNSSWNLPECSDIIYPNIKLKTRYNDKTEKIEVFPDLDGYGKYKGYDTIPQGSIFRTSGPYILDEIPSVFKKKS